MSHRRRQPNRTRLVVAVSLVALTFASLLVFMVVRYASRNPEQVNLGPQVLRFRADRLAREIEEGGPFLFKDPLNREREVYVQHLGGDPRTGWSGIRAYASKVAVECLLRWDGAQRRFVDPCTGKGYPPSGEGLTKYPAKVEDGVVSVDLRTARP